MKRWLFTLAAFLSLLLALATAAAWATSLFLTASVVVNVPRFEDSGVGLCAGCVGVFANTSPGADAWGYRGIVLKPAANFRDFESERNFQAQHGFSGGGFFVTRSEHLGRSGVDVIVPCWFLLLAALPLPILWLRAWLRRRSIGPGCCPSCGYDLRGSPAGGDCPECGAKRAAETESAHEAKAPG
ncbi:MAG: hypothetical protein NTW19_09655 [Planctomycetota bacterium]|nr:hypothetical protein [Planctomycetota bacterium]